MLKVSSGLLVGKIFLIALLLVFFIVIPAEFSQAKITEVVDDDPVYLPSKNGIVAKVRYIGIGTAVV